MHKIGLWGALLFIGAGCGDKVEIVQDMRERGENGESCTSRSDCEEGLACIDNRCIDPDAASGQRDGGMAGQVTDTRGAQGESCTRRADCQSGHACIDNVCIGEEALPEGMPPIVRGGRGESCQARNDCQGDLACINQRCIENDFSLDVETKQCFRVQCAKDEDCCENFVVPVNCPALKTACDGGDTASCTLYDVQCVCRLGCQAQLCTTINTCSVDADCGNVQLRCFGGRCAQCMSSTDCTGADQQCVNGVCRAGCTRNEQCPLFHECRSGECIEVGCQTARECFFATHNPLSECQDGTCVTPCENDGECGDFQVCADERCQFVGCTSDEECRIYLSLANVPGFDRAVCREPDR